MFRTLMVLSASALTLSACTYSSYGPDDHRSMESAGLIASNDVDVTGDAEFAGMVVRADGDIGGDLEMAGATVRSNANVGGNLEAAGARLRFTGSVAGDAEIASASAHINAVIGGRTEIAAARLRLDGELQGPVEIAAARATLRGEYQQMLQFNGEGRDRSGRVELEGDFLGGGAVCATEIEIASSARFEGDFVFAAEERPDNLPAGAEFIALDGRECDRGVDSRFG